LTRGLVAVEDLLDGKHEVWCALYLVDHRGSRQGKREPIRIGQRGRSRRLVIEAEVVRDHSRDLQLPRERALAGLPRTRDGPRTAYREDVFEARSRFRA
jgi:hypothetical protein